MSRAVVVGELNNIKSIEYIDDYPLPDLKDNLIEVEVKYVGLNFADLYMQSGLGFVPAPFVPGIECSGTITQVANEKNQTFKKGDKVMCYNYKGGLLRNKVRVPSSQCYLVPEFMDLQSAAAFFVNYLTAYFSLFYLGHLKTNEKVFISSCAGGVGIAAIQLAKTVGPIQIYGTCSKDKEEFIKSLGVKYISNETSRLDENLSKTNGEGFDLILESQSTETRLILSKHVREFGRIIIVGAKDLINQDLKHFKSEVDPVDLIFGNFAVSGLHLGVIAEKRPDLIQQSLDELYRLMISGSVKPFISNTYKYEDFLEALKEIKERRNIGKILIEI